MQIPFGPWRPDLPSLDNYSTEATNVVPSQGSYESQPSLIEYYNSLANRCQGAISVLDSNNNTFWFSGDTNSLYMIQNGIWVDVSYVLPINIDISAQSFISDTEFGSPIFVNDSIGNLIQGISVGTATFIIVSGKSISISPGNLSTATNIQVTGTVSTPLVSGRIVVISQRSISGIFSTGTTVIVPGVSGLSVSAQYGRIAEVLPIGLRQRTSFIIPTKMIVDISGFSTLANVGRVSPIISAMGNVHTFSMGDTGISALPPPPAVAASLTSLFFNDDFSSISLYHPTNNPTGKWKFLDYWQDVEQAGYVDYAGGTFVVNQCCTGAGATSINNASAHTIIQPYFPASQLDATTMRLTCQRAHLDTRPSLRTLINDIAVNTQSQAPDQVTWLGAWLTTETHHPYSGDDITPPAYLESRIRFSPTTNGIFSAFWVYSTSESANSDEIDIFETDDLVPSIWKTNFHNVVQVGLSHNTAWCDGNFHIFGMLWQAASVKIYRDNVLDGSLSVTYANSMRLILSHRCDPYWSAGIGKQVSAGVESVYMDVDYVRVWR